MSIVSKFFIIVSLLFFLASGYTIYKKNELSSHFAQNVAREKIAKTYYSIPRNTVNAKEEKWNDPSVLHGEENWTFDMFTSPTIVKKENQYQASYPWIVKKISEKGEVEIEFELVSIEKKLYPIQFSGHIILPAKNGENGNELVFIVNDVKNNKILQVGIGVNIQPYDINILKFEKNGPNGEFNGYPRLIVTDNIAGRNEILTSEKKYYDNIFDVKINCKSNGKDFNLSKIGETFVVEGKIYSLHSVDAVAKKIELQQNSTENIITVEVSNTSNASKKDSEEQTPEVKNEMNSQQNPENQEMYG